MHITPTGGGPVGAEVALIEAGLAKLLPEVAPLPAPAHSPAPTTAHPAPQQVGGVDVAVFHELAPADVPKLMQIVQPEPLPEHAVQLDHVLQQAGREVAEGKIEEAVGHLAEAAALAPKQAEELSARPELEPIRTEVDLLVNRLTNAAMIDADVKLTQADHTVEAAAGQKMPQWETRPETVLQVAHGLFAAGGYANYLRSADLADAVQSAYWGATIIEPQVTGLPETRLSTKGERGEDGEPGLARQGLGVLRQELPPRIQHLWQRAPLLVLLLAWLGMGVGAAVCWLAIKQIWPESWVASLGDFGFEVWGLGFLALVGFGFYARVRKEH